MQHGAQGHNSQVFEEMIHIPMVLVADPPLPASGSVIHQPVSLLDLLPTLKDLCGLPDTRQRPRGIALTGLLEGSAWEDSRLHYYSSRYRKNKSPGQYAIRAGSMKLIETADAVRLHNLEEDPGELHSVADQHPILTQTLREELARWRAEAEAERAPAMRVRITGQRAEQLKILGYGGDD